MSIFEQEGPLINVPTEKLLSCEGLSPDTVSIWLTKEDNPEAEQITFISTSEDAFVWAQGPEGCDGDMYRHNYRNLKVSHIL